MVSGKKGCKVQSKTFTVFNLIDADLTDCKINWDPRDICPEQTIGTGGKIPKFGSAEVSYFAAPPPIGCTKLRYISCNWEGLQDCKFQTINEINVPIPNLYVKERLNPPPNSYNCEIATDPKSLFG